jgi:hypothetical protein
MKVSSALPDMVAEITQTHLSQVAGIGDRKFMAYEEC